MKKRILFVTRQAGSVAAFEPLLGSLQENKWSYDILAFGKSLLEWEKYGYQVNSRNISNANDLNGYRLVLTGTSKKVKKDAFYWKLAKENGIPSVAFVDSWVNYSERFTEKDIFDKTPDYIGLADELMYRRMVENGAPIQKLVILGHPRFDSILQKYTLHSYASSDTDRLNIVFFTDPVHRNKTDKVGYDSQTVVQSVLDQILHQSQHLKRKVNFTIKPHPREKLDDYKALIKSEDDEEFASISNETPLTLMVKADVVMGMNTILLIDSSLLGIPTYSFQPGRNATNNDITDRRNIHVSTSWEDMENEISKIFLNKSARNKIKFKKKYNTERFIKFIDSISNDSNICLKDLTFRMLFLN